MTTTRTDAKLAAEQPIDWLVDILRGADPSVAISRRDTPDRHIELERYTVFPSESDPRLIITASSSRVRAAALRRVGSQSSPAMKLARRIGAELARAGLDQLATGPDIILSVDATLVTEAPGDRAPMTLVEYMETALGIPGIHIAATNGPLRPNRKPVLQIMDADGRLIAYAKIGWDSSTREMVATEAAVLEELTDRGLRDIVTPRVIHFGTWRNLVVLATEPLDHADVGVPDANIVAVGLREVAHHLGTVRSPLEKSEWLADVTRRARRPHVRDSGIRELVERLTVNHGATELTFGFGHGDWAPWNMARLGEKLGIWDWERASNDVPIGLDLMHFHYQQEFHANGNVVGAALNTVHQSVVDGLRQLRVDPGTARLIAVLYLVEFSLRYAESGLSTDFTLQATQQDLMTQLSERIDCLEPRATSLIGTVSMPAAKSGHMAGLFTRRMLGGTGVPAPVRDIAKSSVKAWGRATAGKRVLPNTFIVGGQRCGTTSLFRYLTQHRSVTGPMLEKGVHYFDTGYSADLDWYRSHFPTTRSARLSLQRNGCDLRVVEAAPYYLFHPSVAERIAEVSESARIIALVRDPAERALSHHNHEVKRGFEIESFEKALELEKQRLDGEVDKMAADPSYVSYAHQHHSYIARGRYEDQLARYDDLFGSENVLVLRTSDLESDPGATVQRALSFLGVPVLGDIKFPRFNVRNYAAMDPEIEEMLRIEFAPTEAAIGERFDLDDPWG